jgi:hypothetical protein
MVRKCSILLMPSMHMIVSMLLIVTVLLILGGCSDLPGTSDTSAGKIIPPTDTTSPFSGKWTVQEDLGTGEGPEGTVPQWTGKSVQFTEDCVALDDTIWANISYKIKRVDAADYLALKYMSYPDFFAEQVQQVEIVTVYADDNYLGEAMKMDDFNMVFFVQDRGLLLIKVSDEADIMLDSSVSAEQNLILNRNQSASGVLLGLRIPGETGSAYRTLWVAADRGKMHPVLMSESLFFPRTSGFWELDARDIFIEGMRGNLLSARNVALKALKAVNEDSAEIGAAADEASDGATDAASDEYKIEIDSSEKTIAYIGNDYIAVEKKDDGVSRLMVLPVDNLSNSTEMKLSDLLGEKGMDSLLSAREQEVDALRSNGIRLFERNNLDTNFGLGRKNGHWILVGRINYQSEGKSAHTDFDIKIVPPVSLVSYDTLVLSWPKIKDRVPDALDAFTSPNKDIALVQTKNKLTVYKIGAEQLSENPLAEIDIPENTTVIMAEWATGSYVESWGNSFLSYGARVLDEDSVRMH